MPIESLDSLSFFLAEHVHLKFLASRHTETIKWHAKPFTTIFKRPAYGISGH
jgi:hypothetical protein